MPDSVQDKIASLDRWDQELSNGIWHAYTGMSYTIRKLLNDRELLNDMELLNDREQDKIARGLGP